MFYNKNILKKIKIVFFDFDGVFTDNRVIVSEDGKESAFCSRADGIGLSMLKRSGIKLAVISSEPNPIVKFRTEKLNIDCYYNIDDKLSVLKDILNKNDLSFYQAAYIGNDINDIECLKNVGVPIAVNDAYQEVKKTAKIILKNKGGYGAVREFCDLLYRIILRNKN